jgi:hypothetical protein
MLANILLAPLDSRKLFILDLTSLLNGPWHVTLALDPFNLRHMRIPLDKSLIVLQLRPLAGTLDSTAVRGIGTPQSNVSII